MAGGAAGGAGGAAGAGVAGGPAGGATNGAASAGGASSSGTAGGAANAGGAAGGGAPTKREHFGSRLGFLLISAGCAIGLGNVWRFPSMVGEYGGAAFLLLYILFLVIFGLPILCMEFAVGRASQKSSARSFEVLEPRGTKWHWVKWLSLGGNYLLMMFYTTVAGWMMAYFFKTATGSLGNLEPAQVTGVFSSMLASPVELTLWMVAVVLIGFAVCSMGVQKGIERITKVMMGGLFVIMAILVVVAVTLDGAAEGLQFYLAPDFDKLFAGGVLGFLEIACAAMSQAFFTLSIGIGSMAIFGSYIGRDRRLMGEAVSVGVLDFIVAFMAGLIIFPACFSFGISPDSGPSLIFITLPNVFGAMRLGQVWGTLFFLLMTFAALSTVIAVFENLIAFSMDEWGMSRRRAVLRNLAAMLLLSLPCVLGYNVLSGVVVPGIGDIQSLEDFIVSSNLLPIGSLVYVLFCTHKSGWGFKNFLAEADAGNGISFPTWAHLWVAYGIPALIVVVLVFGYIPVVRAWMGM